MKEGTKKIIEKKKELHSSTPFITWRYLVMKHNEHEVAKAQKEANDLGVDELQLMAIHGDMGQELYWNEKRMVRENAEWLPLDAKYRLDRIKPCNFLWVQTVINWNGSVSPCCAVYPEKDDFGNIFDAGGFKKIWNNEKYRVARRIIRRKRINRSHDIMENVCARCLINSGSIKKIVINE
jgi:radical SAM protein with 4Fe4S-binding SPASM domain